MSEKDPGTYEPKIKATCSGGKSVTATLTVTVKPAPHGLDAQYNYDESPAKYVTVYVTTVSDTHLDVYKRQRGLRADL